MKSKVLGIVSLFFSVILLSSCDLFVGVGGIDSEPPVITISTPQDGSIYSPGDIVISGSATDNDKIRDIVIYLGNEEKARLGNKNVFQHTLSIGSPGVYEISVKAIDNVGNESEKKVKITIDTGGPVITIQTPEENKFYKGIISASGTVSDDSGINTVEWSLDGVTWNTLVSSYLDKEYNFSFSIVSTNYNDGLYYLYIRAKDVTEKLSIRNVSLYINNNLSNTIISPIPGQAISGVENIRGNILVNNPIFISNISLIVETNSGGVYIITNIPTSINYSYDFDADELESGLNVTFKIVVNSYSGLSITNSVVTYVDKTYPSINVVFPTNGSFLKNFIYTFHGTSYDDTGIKQVLISFDNNTFSQVSISNDGTNYFWYTNIYTANLSEGDNELYVTVVDLDNKPKSTRALFTVDKTLPNITIISPSNNSTVGTNFVISANAVDNYAVMSFFVKLDGVVVVSNGNISSLSSVYLNFVTNLSGEGARILDFIAQDVAGNIANVTYTISINSDPARTSNIIITSSSGTNLYVKGLATIYGVSYDSVEVSNVYYSIGNDEVIFITNAGVTSTNWVFNFNSGNYSDGLTQLSIKAVDNLGGFTYYTTNIYIDNTTPYVSVLNVQNGEYLGGFINLQVLITDNISLLSFSLLTNGSLFTNDSSIPEGDKESLYILPQWDLSSQSDGTTNTIVSIVVDRAFTTNIVTNWFVISNDIPIMTVNEPLVNQYVSNKVLVSGIAIKSPQGIKETQLKIGSQNFVVASTNNISSDGFTNEFSHVFDTTLVPQGLQIITVRGIASNNSYNQVTIPVIVDYTLPSLTFISLTDGASYYGTITVSGKAWDNLGISNVNVYIKTNNVALPGWDPAIVSLDSSSNWSTNWDTTTLPVGYVEITVEAVDYAGNSTNIAKNIIIRPYISSISPNSAWVGGGINITGSNFGTGSARIIYNGATNTITASPANLNDIVPSSAKSGYLLVEVNGITSINSNWVDVWEITGYPPITAAQINSGFKAYSNKIYFAQSAKSGSSWASNNLLSDYTSTFTQYPFISSSTPNGEVVGLGNAIDARGNLVAIAYSPVKMNGVWVTTFTNNGVNLIRITNYKIDTITLQGSDPRIGVRIGSDLSIHVAYSDFANGTIKYAKSTTYGTSWTIENAVTNLTFHPTLKDAQPRIDLDTSGLPHISYYDHGIGKLRHAYKLISGEWMTETVDTMQLNGQYSSIKIDDNNTIHISYYNGDQGDLMYSYKPSGGQWTRILIDYSAITGYYTSIDTYGSEKAIAYYSTTYQNGWLAYNNGSDVNNWRIIQIPQTPTLSVPYGLHCGVNFSPDGNQIWVGFIEQSDLSLWVAKYKKP